MKKVLDLNKYKFYCKKTDVLEHSDKSFYNTKEKKYIPKSHSIVQNNKLYVTLWLYDTLRKDTKVYKTQYRFLCNIHEVINYNDKCYQHKYNELMFIPKKLTKVQGSDLLIDKWWFKNYRK